ncbi:MAG: hypothetical protein R2727_00715 [Bacteroidales bacterium]
MDKLERNIRNMRQELDRYEPDPSVWDRIEKIPARRANLGIIVSRAAMLVLLVASSFFIYSLASRYYSGPVTAGSNPESIQSPELLEAETYYNSRVKSLLLEARPLFTSNPELESELMIELSQLDSICEDIRRDLKDNISNQEVIEALIMNYRIKVNMLEDMVEMLKGENVDNRNKTEEHEL